MIDTALIMDCDGTLVRINRSYNACIIESVHRMLGYIFNSYSWEGYVDEDLILAFRMSGGFNNDVDTCYALILAGAVAVYTNNINNVRDIAYELARSADARGVESVEEYLKGKGLDNIVRMVREHTGYPGLVGSSMLATLFDELFYGRLFERMHGMKPRFVEHEGFINYDEVIIKEGVLKELNGIFGSNIAIVSGRSRLATEYTLKDLLRYFNLEASVFIEDEDKDAKRNNMDIMVKKPSPYALLKSLKMLGVSNAIMVGDSIEDLIMAKSIDGHDGYRARFIGVYGTSIDGKKQREAFIARGADHVVENVNLLPTLLYSYKA